MDDLGGRIEEERPSAATRTFPPQSRPRESASKSQQVVELILQRLEQGEWKMGDKLPPERELAAFFKVSRGVVREALHALDLSGHIETRVSEGSFVRISNSMSRTMQAATVVAGLGVADGLEVRQGLEIACACLAIERATPADLLRMDACVLDMEENLTRGDFAAYIESTLPFHLSIAHAAHAPALVEVVATLMESHRTDQWIDSDHTAENATYSLAVHRAIASAIHDRDMQSAVQAITSHYQDYSLLQTLDI